MFQFRGADTGPSRIDASFYRDGGITKAFAIPAAEKLGEDQEPVEVT